MSDSPLKTRPKLCPCPNSCTPIRNELGRDDRIIDGDLNEGYSGDCIGKGDESVYVVGGNEHKNDMNHCIFTPLKGVIRYQICEGDVEAMLHMARGVLRDLNPDRKCENCGANHPFTHFIISGDRRLCCRCYYAGQGGASGESEAT